MHVLQLLPSLDVGGVERGVLDLSQGFIARGHQVTVISSGGALVDPLIHLGAQHVTLPVHAKSPAAIRYCMPAVAQLIRQRHIDVVHARSRVPAWIGWAAARWAQRPFVTTAHGFYAPHPASRVMTWGRLVIAPSEALGRYLVEQFRLPKSRLRIIPRGVDLKRFQFAPSTHAPQGPWRIGLIGRFSRIKGHEVALRACAQLIRSGQAVRLCLAGEAADSPAGTRLQSLAASLGMREHIELCGVVPEVPSLIASMDVVIVPSTYPESFGRSVIEAQAVGRPVVASRLGALPELIRDGATGLLAPPGDPQALAEAIARFLHDATLRQRCVEAARRDVEANWTLEGMVEKTLAVYDECLSRPRILIWKLSALGDVVLSTPSLRAVRRKFPKAHISAVVGRGAYEAIARCPYLDELIIYDPRRKDRGWQRHGAFVRRLRHGAFDWSIDLQNSRTTHLMAWAAGIPLRLGYRRKFGWLLNRGVRLPRVVLTPIAHQQYLLRQGGISPDGEALEVWPSPLDEQRAAELLGPLAQGIAPLIGIQPGGSGRWHTKRWPLARWAALCDLLAQQGACVLVTGGPEEVGLGDALRTLTKSPPRILIGHTSLMELACLIRRCQVFLTHDSAALHLAAAVGTPTVALFGPTDPRRHVPSTFVGQVIAKDVFCSPCYSPRCRTLTHACMQRITIDEVRQAILGLLDDADMRKRADGQTG